MKYIVLAFFTLSILACQDAREEGVVDLKVHVDGLKVGNLYLKSFRDSTLVTVDSSLVDGDDEVHLRAKINEPELMYLHMDVKDGKAYDDYVSFFAEDTLMVATSTLTDFEADMEIMGSKNHDVLSQFNKNLVRLNETYTKIVKRNLALAQEGMMVPEKQDSIEQAYNKYLRKKVLYAVNYAQLNKEYPVAAYILHNHASEANPRLLDSTFVQFTPEVQASIYGQKIKALLDRKEE